MGLGFNVFFGFFDALFLCLLPCCLLPLPVTICTPKEKGFFSFAIGFLMGQFLNLGCYCFITHRVAELFYSEMVTAYLQQHSHSQKSKLVPYSLILSLLTLAWQPSSMGYPFASNEQGSGVFNTAIDEPSGSTVVTTVPPVVGSRYLARWTRRLVRKLKEP